MREKGVWATLKRGVQGLGLFERVENLLADGMPDVNFVTNRVEGWIELKWVEKWPVKASSVVKVGVKPGQRVWWKKRREMGSNVFVFVRIGDWFGLFDAYAVWDTLGESLTQEDCRRLAIDSWDGKVNWHEFILALCSCPTLPPKS
jgi:hypothetical protein